MPLERVLLIRHAEKPGVDNATGVNVDGLPDPESLTPRGWQRAGALVRYFCPALAAPGAVNKTPAHIFAAGVGYGSKSSRSIQTVAPLATFLQLPTQTGHLKDDYPAMVTDVQGSDGVVLVAWEHKLLPAIANLLLGTAGAPSIWPGDRFDLVWMLEPAGGGWQLTELNQSLLPGDAP